MARYLVESPHTKEECVVALEEIKDKHPELLNKMEFGCKAGEHVGWAMVDAGSESEVCGMIPEAIRSKAHVVELVKFTPEQIESFHSM
jgi:uncharacterized protein YdhG (YjbR/CyaY superfamily)